MQRDITAIINDRVSQPAGMTNQVYFKCILMAAAYIASVSSDGDKPKQLSILVSYETESDPATCFFSNQLNCELFDSLNKCGVIRWNFMPCSTSSMVGGQLVCRGGCEQCKWDKIHACAAAIYAEHQDQVGKFVICFFSSNKNAEECANKHGMCYKTIEACVNDGKADKYCEAFFNRIINDYQTVYNPGLKFGSNYDATLNYNAVLDFKPNLCTALQKNGLKCDEVCPPCGGQGSP